MVNLGSIQDRIRPSGQNGLQALVPVVTVLISGLVLILAVSPAYLRELHPFTLLLLAIACAIPVWAWNQMLWWYTGRSISAAIVFKVTYILDVPEKRRTAYGFALTELLKALDVFRFLPHENIANFLTVITIYIGAVFCYLTGTSPTGLYACILGLGLLVWACGMFFLRRSLGKIDVEPLRQFWHDLKNNDELLANINRHLERMEKALLANVKGGGNAAG